MSKSTPEGKIKDMTRKMLKRYPVWVYMPVSLGMGMHGVPDLLCCLRSRDRGYFFTIETKALGKKPTALQEKCMAEIRQYGGKTFVVDGEESLLEVERWIEEVL